MLGWITVLINTTVRERRGENEGGGRANGVEGQAPYCEILHVIFTDLHTCNIYACKCSPRPYLHTCEFTFYTRVKYTHVDATHVHISTWQNIRV